MKKFLKVAACSLAINFLVVGSAAAQDKPLVEIFREDVRFSESVLPHDGGIFISNFGSEKMNPRPDENSGYIIFRKDGVSKKIVENLHQPTGMAVKNNFLFVCDGARLLAYDLERLNLPPQVITFAAEDKVVNALAADGDTLYISITDSGKIYSLDVSDPKNLKSPKLWLKIVGANGMAIGGGEMFIATIPPDYKNVAAENIVYRVRNLENPIAEKFYDVPGLYDGAALSDDLKTLYVSDWKTSAVIAIDILSQKVRVIYAEKGIGPADIAQRGGRIFIPELVGSRIIEIQTP